MSYLPTINEVELTKEQLSKWEDTRVALSWNCPAFTHIFINLCSHGKHGAIFTRDMPNAAATDGVRIIINPDVFFKYDLMERLFILTHEILHCMFNHLIHLEKWRVTGQVVYPDGVKLPFDMNRMNVALDLVINAILINAKVGKFNKEWLYDTTIATHMDVGIDIYRKLWQQFPPPPPPPKRPKRPGEGEPCKDGQGNNPTPAGNEPAPIGPKGKSFDEHKKPGELEGKEPHQAVNERNDAEWETHLAAAANLQRLQGKMPAGLERVFQELLTPQVNWREHIQAELARKLGSGSYNWQKPDRRLIVRDIYTPSRSGYGCGVVVVGVDTSGSIQDKEISMFMAEVSGILEDVKPKELIILWCDAKVHRADYCDSPSDLNEIRAKGVPGHGGTDFRPVFNWIEDNDVRPDCVVYLTDGHGDFPQTKPSYNTIWASIDKKDYPFGSVVAVPKQARDQ